MDSTERATRVEVVRPTVALSVDRGSLVFAGAVGFNTDWGASYRVTSVTSVDTYADGELAGLVRIEPAFGDLLREEGERVWVRCSAEMSAVAAATKD